MKISEHFTESEFFQKGKSGKIFSCDHVKARCFAWVLLEPARKVINKPIHINSGKRSPKHNSRVDGASGSEHLWREDYAACDLDTRDPFLNKILFNWFYQNCQFAIGQLIAYLDLKGGIRFIHISLASTKRFECEVLLATYEKIGGKRKYNCYNGGDLKRPN